ncbi:MAG: multi-domain protein, partial [Candidatus Pelagibacter sp.]
MEKNSEFYKKKKFIKIKSSYDNYVGYIKSSNYVNKFKPTHKVSVLKSRIF